MSDLQASINTLAHVPDQRGHKYQTQMICVPVAGATLLSMMRHAYTADSFSWAQLRFWGMGVAVATSSAQL